MSIFEKKYQEAVRRGIIPKTKESMDWYKKNMNDLSGLRGETLLRENRGMLVNSWTNTAIGKFYFVSYDPKHKKTLPYYDQFPMILVLEKYNDGILSLNFHYLSPILRAKLLDALYDVLNNTKMDKTTRLRITYGILKNASKYKWFKPCIKRYLGSHFRSRFLLIEPKYWEMAMFLPVASFRKAPQNQVWADSKNIATT